LLRQVFFYYRERVREVTVEITVLIAIASFLIGLVSFSRNRDKDVKNDATKSAVIETKLDNISQSVDSIRIDLKANDQRWNSLSDRVIRVEESSKQAHKRLDNLMNKVDKGDM
jgi:septal ring factor EnvC (AmiA/AmiB activator)